MQNRGECNLSQSALHGWHRTGGRDRGESEALDERETLIMSHMCTANCLLTPASNTHTSRGTWRQPPNKQHALFMIINQGQGG